MGLWMIAYAFNRRKWSLLKSRKTFYHNPKSGTTFKWRKRNWYTPSFTLMLYVRRTNSATTVSNGMWRKFKTWWNFHWRSLPNQVTFWNCDIVPFSYFWIELSCSSVRKYRIVQINNIAEQSSFLKSNRKKQICTFCKSTTPVVSLVIDIYAESGYCRHDETSLSLSWPIDSKK